MEFVGQLPSRVTIEVVNQLLACRLCRRWPLRRDHPSFRCASFIVVGVLCLGSLLAWLPCRGRCRLGFWFFVLIVVSTGLEGRQEDKQGGQESNFHTAHKLLLSGLWRAAHVKQLG